MAVNIADCARDTFVTGRNMTMAYFLWFITVMRIDFTYKCVILGM
jgi:hypothetical protein